MVILDGETDIFTEAAGMVIRKPHPEHVKEYHYVNGYQEHIVRMVDNSIMATALGAAAIKDGEAMIAGVTLSGIIFYELWMLTTAGAARNAPWLLRQCRRMLRWSDSVMRWPLGYAQEIPDNYPAGIRFAERMGFHEAGRRPSPVDDRVMVVKLERMISKSACTERTGA